MAMQEGTTQDGCDRAKGAINAQPESGMERSLTDKPSSVASATLNVRAMGLLMGATSLIGPILADGSY